MSSDRFHGAGPNVFISYSFKDEQIAGNLSSLLARAGYRVRCEDETSLIGRRLTSALSERIGTAEAFVQICTPASRKSKWVAKELDFATSLQTQERAARTIIPVRFERDGEEVTGSEPVDASGGLSEVVLGELQRLILGSIHCLSLNQSDPFQFDAAAVDTVLREASLGTKRVIIDSDDLLLRWMDESLELSHGSTVPHKNALLKHERRRKDWLRAYLLEMDQQAESLIARLVANYAAWNCEFPGTARHALNFFGLVRIGNVVLERADPIAPQIEHYRQRFETLLRWLPRDRIFRAYFYMLAGDEDPLRYRASRQNYAELAALNEIGVDDKAFEGFASQATDWLNRILNRGTI